MSKIRILAFLCLLLVINGCGSETSINVDPAIAPYFYRFNKDIGFDPINITAQILMLDFPKVGQCIIYESGKRVVQMDVTYWQSASDNMKEEAVFHELGHAFGLEHIYGVTDTYCPVSIMYPYSFGNSACYFNNKKYYYDELKSHIVISSLTEK